MSNISFRTHNVLPLRLHDQPPAILSGLFGGPTVQNVERFGTAGGTAMDDTDFIIVFASDGVPPPPETVVTLPQNPAEGQVVYVKNASGAPDLDSFTISSGAIGFVLSSGEAAGPGTTDIGIGGSQVFIFSSSSGTPLWYQL